MSGTPTSRYAGWRPGWVFGALALLAGWGGVAAAQSALPPPGAPESLPALLPDEQAGVKIIMTKKAAAGADAAPIANPLGAGAGESKTAPPDLGPGTVVGDPTTMVDPNVQQAAGSCKCANVAAPGDTGPLPPVSPINAGDNYYSTGCGCGGACCVPGKPCCHMDCDTSTWYGRCWAGFYECICCEDHCYEPAWHPLDDSAFFTDPARPITEFTLAYEHDEHMPFPDRGEYFMAHNGSIAGVVPANVPLATVAIPKFGSFGPIGVGGQLPFIPSTGAIPGKGLHFAEQAVNADELMMIMSAGAGRAGITITTPFESISPEDNTHASGYGDTTIAAKSLLLDCELLQLAFQFKTEIPTGNFTRGLGTGHTAIEPDLLLALKLGPCTSLQAELGENIPLGGDVDYQSEILKYSFSLNHILWEPMPKVQLIGTLEGVGMTFQNGEYTDPAAINLLRVGAAPGLGSIPVPAGLPNGAVFGYNLLPQRAATTYFSAGPGVRFVMCNKLDIGIGTQFHLTDERYADEVFRFEFRYRF